jgi:hypothetical protein
LGDNCKQSGRAGAYVRLKYSADKFPNSVPNIQFDIKGALLFDPRTSTTVYSENPALAVRDFLTNTKYGLGASSGEINDTAVIAAANNCEESVPLKSGGNLSGGNTYRYLCNGGFTTDQKPADILEQLLSSMAGYLTWLNGKWNIYAGVWRSPTVTLTDDDLRAPVQVQVLASKSELCNRVGGAIINATTGTWQPMDFAPYCEDAGHGFGSDQWYIQDNSERIDRRIALPFTIDSPMAQRLAKIYLERIRRQMRATWPCKITAYQLQPADVVQITRSRYSWVSKTFEIVQAVLSFQPDDQGVAVPAVDLSLRETDSGVYAWNGALEELADPSPGTVVLPDATIVPAPTGLTLSSTTTTRADGIVATFMKASWTAPTGTGAAQIKSIIVEYKLHSSGTWEMADVVDASITSVKIDAVSEGSIYDVQVYSLSNAGSTSAIVQALSFTVGATASNYSYRPLTNPLTATDAGASDTVSCAAFTMRVGGNDVSISSGSVASLSRKTLYFIYYTDTSIAGGSVTFSASTTKETALASAGRFFVGSIYTPAAGSPDTVGNNDGGSGAQIGDTWIMQPTIYSVANGVWLPVGINSTGTHDGFSYAAVDGDGSTSGTAINLSAGDLIITFAGWPAFTNRWKSLKLFVKSSGSTTNNAGNSLTVAYSTDSFSTSTTIWTIGANATHTVSLDSASLATTIPAGNIQVQFTLHVAAGSTTANIYEVWLEGQI